jgi:hypothetical protein
MRIRSLQHGTLITLATSLLALALLVTGVFLPSVYDFVRRVHVFEILVLTMLGSLVWLAEAPPSRRSACKVLASDPNGVAELEEFIAKNHISRIDLLGAGLGTRHALVGRLAQAGVPLRVLIQDPKSCIDRADGKRINGMIEKTRAHVGPDRDGLVSFFYYTEPATIRAVLLYGRNGNPIAALMGWYLYEGDPISIVTDPWPVIWVLAGSDDNDLIISFVRQLIERRLNSSRVYTPLNISASMKSAKPGQP